MMDHLKKRLKKLKLIILLAIIIILYIYLSKTDLIQDFLSNPAELRQLLLDFGILSHILIIVLIIFQTTISIIPSNILVILAGFTFGPVLGLTYSLIGSFIGSAIIFKISKKYGKGIALKFFEKKDLVHFTLFMKQKKKFALFLGRVTPLFPNDLVSFGAGLTDIKFYNFNIFSTIGFFVKMIILTLFGADLATGNFNITFFILIFLVSFMFLLVLFKNKIKRIIIKDLHKLEKEGKIIEKEIEKEFKKI